VDRSQRIPCAVIMSSVVGTVFLNDYLQRHGMAEYLSWEESSTGPAHDALWKVICKIDGVPYGVGMAKSKKEAKNKASFETRKALEEKAAAMDGVANG